MQVNDLSPSTNGDVLQDVCEGLNKLDLQNTDIGDFANEVKYLMDGYWSLREALKNDVKELKISLDAKKSERSKLKSHEHKLEEILKQTTDTVTKLKDEEEMLRKEIVAMQAIYQEKKENIECLLEEKKPHEHDIAIIDKNRKILKFCKDFTGIKWDYRASSDCIGIVFNPSRNYVKHFSYPGIQREKVWKEIENAVLPHPSDDELQG